MTSLCTHWKKLWGNQWIMAFFSDNYKKMLLTYCVFFSVFSFLLYFIPILIAPPFISISLLLTLYSFSNLELLWWPSNLRRAKANLCLPCRILENAFILCFWPILWEGIQSFNCSSKTYIFPFILVDSFSNNGDSSSLKIHDIWRDGQILLSIFIICYQGNHPVVWNSQLALDNLWIRVLWIFRLQIFCFELQVSPPPQIQKQSRTWPPEKSPILYIANKRKIKQPWKTITHGAYQIVLGKRQCRLSLGMLDHEKRK